MLLPRLVLFERLKCIELQLPVLPIRISDVNIGLAGVRTVLTSNDGFYVSRKLKRSNRYMLVTANITIGLVRLNVMCYPCLPNGKCNPSL